MIYQVVFYIVISFSSIIVYVYCFFFFFQAEDGIRDYKVTGVQTCALPIFDLSDAQRDQVFKIFHDQSPAMHERMKAARAAREDLEKLALASAFDRERARAIADTEAKAIADMELLRAESMARVRQVLTAEQRAKLDQMREHRR